MDRRDEQIEPSPLRYLDEPTGAQVRESRGNPKDGPQGSGQRGGFDGMPARATANRAPASAKPRTATRMSS